MKHRVAQLFPLLLMLGLALATLWLERLVQLPPIPPKDTLRHDPDFIVENFVLTQMNAQGHPDTSLAAPRMVHYPDDDTTELERPKYVRHTVDQPPVEITGDAGVVSQRGDLVQVSGNVVATRGAVDGRPPLVMRTTILEIEPETEIARTDAHVEITEGDRRLEGVGMIVQGKLRDFELKSRVRGTLPPAR